MFALDTNTLIYFFKGQGNVKNRLMDTSPNEINIPAIVIYELTYGILKTSAASKRSKQLESFLECCKLLEFGSKEARAAAKIRAHLESRGEPIGPLDTLIAGTALANGLVLVTHNTREFKKVSGLEIVDWY